jgi:hypothetical protein
VITAGLATFDLGIARMEPCGAVTGPAIACGATPASLYRKACGVPSHDAEVWLCPVHAAITATGGGACRDCAERGGVSAVSIRRLVLAPVRVV